MHAIRPDKRLVRAYCFFSIELGVADLLENILFFLLSTWQGAHQTAIFEYFYILTPERKNCGTDVLTVSRALGHSQSTTTLNIYAHTFSTAQAKASEAIFQKKRKPGNPWYSRLSGLYNLVRMTGLEPVRHGHTPLKRACLPVPAHPHLRLLN